MGLSPGRLLPTPSPGANVALLGSRACRLLQLCGRWEVAFPSPHCPHRTVPPHPPDRADRHGHVCWEWGLAGEDSRPCPSLGSIHTL